MPSPASPPRQAAKYEWRGCQGDRKRCAFLAVAVPRSVSHPYHRRHPARQGHATSIHPQMLTAPRCTILVLLGVLACSRATPPPSSTPVPVRAPEPVLASGGNCCLEAGRLVAERHRVAAIATRRFTHAELWSALDPLLRSSALRVTPIGTSIQGRALRAITFGTGPTRSE